MAHYNRPLIYSSGPAITITTGAGDPLATVDWHTWSGKIDLSFATTGSVVTYRDRFESTTLGRLFWTLTHSDKTGADIRCADRAGQTVCTIVLKDNLRNGRVEMWRRDLSKQQFDEIIVSAIAEIEDLRRKVQDNNQPNYGAISGAALAITN